jgi:hypothetical protein
MPAGTLPLPTYVPPSQQRRHRGKPAWVHLAPAVLLLLILFGLMIYDFVRPAPTLEGDSDDGKRGPGLRYDDVVDRDPVLNFLDNPNSYRFGLVLPKVPDPGNPDQHKRLTYKEDGATNNTCLRIDGQDSLYGQPRGRRAASPKRNNDRLYWSTSWEYPTEKVFVTQEVQIVPGAQSGKLDTCLVHYTVQNKDRVSHKVGLRVMFDTYIGANDGVPFVLANRPGLVTVPQLFPEKEVPDYIQALERPDMSNPGTVAYMGLKGVQIPGITLEPIEKLVIRRFSNSNERWEEEIPEDEKGKPIDDTCVRLFWAYRTMNPGETRHMAFSYGLNAVSAPEGTGNLLLTAGGSFVVGNEFTVHAYIKKPAEGEKVKLVDLPAGLTLAAGQEAEQTVQAKGDYTQVSWRVHSDQVGDYKVQAISTGGARALLKVPIRARSLFR